MAGDEAAVSPRKKWRQELRKRISEKNGSGNGSDDPNIESSQQEQVGSDSDTEPDEDQLEGGKVTELIQQYQASSRPGIGGDTLAGPGLGEGAAIGEQTSLLLNEKYSFPSDSTLIAALAEEAGAHTHANAILLSPSSNTNLVFSASQRTTRIYPSCSWRTRLTVGDPLIFKIRR